MQVLYLNELGENNSTKELKGLLRKNIENTDRLYMFNLWMIKSVMEFVLTDSVIRSRKHLATEEDLNVDKKIAENVLYEALASNSKIVRAVKQYKLDELVEEDLVRKVFNSLKTSEGYKDYLLGDSTLDTHKFIAVYLFEEVMMNNGLYKEYLEDHFLNFADDGDLVANNVIETISSYMGDRNKLRIFVCRDGDIEELPDPLIEECSHRNEELKEIIAPKLKNWDADRLALIDMILLKMAVCELLYFPTVPIKVTINEYIDISKYYSTPKSKDFINGVLDRTMKELKEAGKIEKTGRGLQGS